MRAPYPLQWPEGFPRTPASSRRVPRFRCGVARARDKLIDELRLLGAANVVITSDLPADRRGQLYADGFKRGTDPAIAVWFMLPDEDGGRFVERVFACDAWDRPEGNLEALALSIGALRGLSRWGSAELQRRAFAGFRALPPGAPDTLPEPTKRPWREVLGGEWPEGLSPGELLLIAQARYRAAMRVHHPDAGGDTERAAELTVAIADAEAEALARRGT